MTLFTKYNEQNDLCNCILIMKLITALNGSIDYLFILSCKHANTNYYLAKSALNTVPNCYQSNAVFLLWPWLQLSSVVIINAYNYNNNYDNCRKHWCTKFIFAHPVYLPETHVIFVYEVHRVKVKVIWEKKSKVPIPAMQKFHQQ